MKAIIKSADAPDALEWRDWPEPRPGPGEVLVGVRRAAVCSTDVAIWDNSYRGRQSSTYPAMVGHEAAGVVEAIGEGVDELQVGDHVCLQVIWAHDQERAALDGYENLDPDWFHLGTATRPGAFAERIAVPAARAIRIPESVDWEDAALVEAHSIAIHAMERLQPVPGEHFVAVGPGTFGLLTAMLARIGGAATVIVVGQRGIDEARLEVARTLGAGHTLLFDGDAAALAEQVRELTDGEGAQLVVDNGGTPSSTPLALELAASAGRVALCGFTQRCEIEPFRQVIRKSLSLHGIAASQRRHYGPALRSLRAGVRPSAIVSHRLPMERASEAMALMKERRATKVLLEPPASS